MANKNQKVRRILIPKDSSSPEATIVKFQHNGVDCIVPLGKITKVPDWVFEQNPAYREYEVE